jgi:diamine N-acetyltransferase
MTQLREPRRDEAAALASLARESFVATFGDLYSSDDLGAFLESSKTEAVFSEQMQDRQYVFQVAEDGGQLVGYCKMGLDPEFDDYDPGGRRPIELKELYLLESHQGAGVAQRLMEWALKVAFDHKADEVVLSVWSGNSKAQRFYKKHGFSWLADTHFMVGSQCDEEFLFMRPMAAAQASPDK